MDRLLAEPPLGGRALPLGVACVRQQRQVAMLAVLRLERAARAGPEQQGTHHEAVHQPRRRAGVQPTDVLAARRVGRRRQDAQEQQQRGLQGGRSGSSTRLDARRRRAAGSRAAPARPLLDALSLHARDALLELDDRRLLRGRRVGGQRQEALHRVAGSSAGLKPRAVAPVRRKGDPPAAAARSALGQASAHCTLIRGGAAPELPAAAACGSARRLAAGDGADAVAEPSRRTGHGPAHGEGDGIAAHRCLATRRGRAPCWRAGDTNSTNKQKQHKQQAHAAALI